MTTPTTKRARVVAFLRENPEALRHWTLRRIAQHCGTQESTASVAVSIYLREMGARNLPPVRRAA